MMDKCKCLGFEDFYPRPFIVDSLFNQDTKGFNCGFGYSRIGLWLLP